MIFYVWYPSGGFGHYINAVITQYGHGFTRPNKTPVFSDNGDSHDMELVATKYFHDPEFYEFEFDPALNYCVLIDNGITNEGTKFKKFFQDNNIIKVCYSDFTWPVVANTMIVKAAKSTLQSELAVDTDQWYSAEPWVQREKYFLFLRDHPLRKAWKPESKYDTIMVDDLLNYNKFYNSLPLNLNNFESLHQNWWEANKQYFLPILTAQKILKGQFEPVDDIWTQAVVYYQIWCQYGIEVPHNDYSNWFKNYNDIVIMLDKHGIQI